MPAHGHVFWLFGLSGAGKSTLADKLAEELRRQGRAVLALDGDILRAGLCHGLGFSDADRLENLRRAAEVAKLGAASGLCVVASFITPREAYRRAVMDILGRPNLSLVYIDAPLSVCQSRDVKGLYARAHKGQIVQMTGISSAFESPVASDLRIDTVEESIEASAARLGAFALARLQILD